MNQIHNMVKMERKRLTVEKEEQKSRMQKNSAPEKWEMHHNDQRKTKKKCITAELLYISAYVFKHRAVDLGTLEGAEVLQERRRQKNVLGTHTK